MIDVPVLVIRLTLAVYCAAHVPVYIGVGFCHPAAQVGSLFVHIRDADAFLPNMAANGAISVETQMDVCIANKA
jgi:hypothetical protein